MMWRAMLVLPLAACALIDSGGKSHDAAPVPPDAAPPDASPPDAWNCTLPAAWGHLGDVEGGAFDLPNRRVFQGQITQDEYPEIISLELYPDNPPFLGTPATGTFALDGLNAFADSCGVCVILYGDTSAGGGFPPIVYLADGGSATLTSVSGTFSGYVENATLRRVVVDPSTGATEDHEDGCRTTVDYFAFSEFVP